MSAYQPFAPGTVFLTLNALAPANGGAVYFYVPGSTELADTWADADLTILNENPVPLDSAGRFETPVWGDGAYDVRQVDGDGATVFTGTVQPEISAGLAIPALEADKFLTNDGTSLDWQPVLQLPDPDGSEGYFLVVVGGIPTWVPPEAAPAGPDITIAANTATIGNGGSRLFIQNGSGTIAPSGGRTASLAVTFPTAFLSTPTVMVVPTVNGITGVGYNAVPCVNSRSPTGFTIQVDVNADQSGANISANVTFDWIAFGRLAAL